MMCFENWDSYVDIYMRVSTWEPDMWPHYTIDDQTMPEDWHKSSTMTWVSNDLWTMEDLRDKKRKRDAMETEAMAIKAPDDEVLSEEATIYQATVAAMTPTATQSPSPEHGL